MRDQDDLINLLEETEEVLQQYGKTWDDVEFIYDGYRNTTIPIEIFKKLADLKYDNGFGGAEVNTRLMIVGEDWWLERYEYDGSESWDYKAKPERPIAEREHTDEDCKRFIWVD